ncbi:uncharacterized protein N7446_001463 [Penicillium canescens]|uniref:Allantoate permease n=1 Tax=Penicillium canescens TaxID=5083 RepID=A0AAD6ICE0_PENCN|nr:uncharacterized protein N7446_001463 [Penicillium canescens]KAJ6043267.1 hypothetical protein N7460_004622 [Penicillium canescens]KAJ6054743.1 hypothetical protein N7444_003841 [Penicillium canescens]KAJ6073686.1 hypothetical protein N7446_001463 [Penicillium canescens]
MALYHRRRRSHGGWPSRSGLVARLSFIGQAKEQRFAKWRLARAADDEVDDNGSIKEALRDAFLDPKAWILVLIQVCQLSSQTRTYFFPTIAKKLGYGNKITLLIIAPMYIFSFITALGNFLIASRTDQRFILIAWPLCVDIVGNIMVISSRCRRWITSTSPRTRTKRAIVYALVNLFGNSINVYGSYFFPTKDSPQYRPGGIILSSFAAGAIV